MKHPLVRAGGKLALIGLPWTVHDALYHNIGFALAYLALALYVLAD